jgi:glycolate oxidase
LIDIVGEEFVSMEEEDIIPYMRDAYTILIDRPIVPPDFVVLPKNVDEVQRIVKLANKYKIPIYPRSFGVNIASSALPYRGGIVIDLRRMDKIIEINEETMTATIEPGVTWGKLRKEARKKGLDIIPIAGPYSPSPVGNFLLTNITPYSTRYSADRVVSLEVVLPNGEILRTGSQCLVNGDKLNPYFRYAYGPDLTGLFRGSLGNFGIVTKLVIRLRPLAEVEENVYYKFDELSVALKAMQRIERLEITRYSTIGNKYLFLRQLLHPEKLRIREEVEKSLARLPNFVLTIGLGGKAKQVALYKEIVEEEVSKVGGEKMELSPDEKNIADEVSEGASQKSIRMFAPYGGFAAVIACIPPSSVLGVTKVVEEKIKKYDLRDPILGEPLTPEIIVIPYDRCSTVYLEQELLYDPTDIDAVEKVKKCLRDCYREIATRYGGVHTIPNKTLFRLLLPSYVKVLTGIKRLLDPNGIMMPGGPYSIEES